MLSADEDTRKRWVEHVSEVINKVTNQPDELKIPDAEEDIELSLRSITISEIERALKSMKHWKAPGCDGIVSEMFEIKKVVSPYLLCRFFNQI